MNRTFARSIDLDNLKPARAGVGGLFEGYNDEVKISPSKLYAGGVTAAAGGMLFGAAVVTLFKPAVVGSVVSTIGILSVLPGAALIGLGYYVLWTGGDKLIPEGA